MYEIERRTSGYIITFSGSINSAEMQKWHNESQRILSLEKSPSFGVIVVMTDLVPLEYNAQSIMVSGQDLYKQKGMQRSAVIVANPIISMQFKRLAKESGIYATERYLDIKTYPNPIELAVKWVKEGIDPDK